MNVIPIDDKLPIFKLPTCPGFLISPPIPLTWQIAVPSDDESNEFNELAITQPPQPHFFHRQIPSLKVNLNLKKNQKAQTIPSLSNTQIIDILHQFGECDNYHSAANNTINGFIHILQQEITSIIPSDIHNICFSFYNEAQNKYIHFSYKLYQIISKQNLQKKYFSGVLLAQIIKTKSNNLLQDVAIDGFNDENVVAICSELVHLHLLRLVSYKTSFSSLFEAKKEEEEEALFVVDEYFLYNFTENTLKAFVQYESPNSMTMNV